MFHAPLRGVFDASSPPRQSPNILLSPIPVVRFLEWKAHEPQSALESCRFRPIPARCRRRESSPYVSTAPHPLLGLAWSRPKSAAFRDSRSDDTPRRMAPFRESGCLEPFLGHMHGGDCSPKDCSSWACALPREADLDATPLSKRALPTKRSVPV